MGNDKVIVELLFILFLLSLSLTFFPGLVKESMDDTGYFQGSRASEDFNVLGIPREGGILLYTKAGSIGQISIDEIPSRSPITEAIHSLHSSRRRFSIHIDDKTSTVQIYSQCAIPDYIFLLKEVPSRRLSPIETLKALDNFYRPVDTMDPRLIQTLVYLGLRGSLEDKLFLLYREMLVVVNAKRQMLFFGLDLDQMSQMVFRGIGVSVLEKKRSSNELQIVFKMESNLLFFYIPGDERSGLGKRMSRNTLGERSAKLFPSARDTKIKNAVDRDDYKGLVGIVSEEERREGMAVLEQVVADFFRPTEPLFFV